MEVLGWAFGLTVAWVLLQPQVAGKTGVLADLANGAIRRAMSPQVAGVPLKAKPAAGQQPSSTPAPTVPTPYNGNGLTSV